MCILGIRTMSKLGVELCNEASSHKKINSSMFTQSTLSGLLRLYRILFLSKVAT